MTAGRPWLREFQEAASTFDRTGLAELSGQYVDHLYGAPQLPPNVTGVLQILRANLRYEELEAVADAALAHGLDAAGGPAVRRHYAQALVDGGNPAVALALYTALAATVTGSEQLEARGGIGRCYKELFLACTDRPRRERYLRRAVQAYLEPYRDDAAQVWHGINAVALLARARRDGIDLGPGVDGVEELAAVVLHTVDRDPDPNRWAAVTACEALIALGRHDEAVERAELFIASHPDGFTVASFLRQLQRVWQLDTTSAPGNELLPVLRSALLALKGGQVVVESADVRADRLGPLGTGRLEAVLARDRFQTLTWYRTGLVRCRAVARIQSVYDDPVGTGFLVAGPDLHPHLPPLVVLTNGHVVPEGLRPEEAVVVFHGLDADPDQPRRFRVARQCWHEPSRSPGLDTTVLELDGYPAGVEPVPLARSLPVRPLSHQRAYVIGHPLGLAQPQFSLQDNILLDYDDRVLHYRSPTEHGSSGSPVFDRTWQLVGVHHAGGTDFLRLNEQGGTYPANEGIRLRAIVDRMRELPPAPSGAPR